MSIVLSIVQKYNNALLCHLLNIRLIITLFQVYFNTIRNWVSLDTDKCLVKPIMFTTNTSGFDVYMLKQYAQQLGWNIFKAPKLSKYDVPFVRHMYMDASNRVPNCRYYAYSNGDILYSRSFIDTLQAVSQVHDFKCTRSTFCGMRVSVPLLKK